MLTHLLRAVPLGIQTHGSELIMEKRGQKLTFLPHQF